MGRWLHAMSLFGLFIDLGQRRADFERETGALPEFVGHPLDQLDLVVDPLEHAGVKRVSAGT
jgi:hypothetical protein